MNGDLQTLADARRQGGNPDREYSDDAQEIGVSGEKEFADKTGLSMPQVLKGGDGGIDFRLSIIIDIKTAKIPKYLICRQGEIRSDVYILYGIRGIEVYPVGWAWGYELRSAPINGPMNHYIPADMLKPIEQIYNLIKHLRFNKGTIDK